MNLTKKASLSVAVLSLVGFLSVLTACDTGSGGLNPASQAKLFSGAFIGSGLTTTVSIGSFSAAASLSEGARAGHTATLLDTGTILVTGGVDANGGFHTENEIYDPAADTWVTVSSLSTPTGGQMLDPAGGTFVTGRQFHTATKTPTGVVVICGGLGFERVVNSTPVIEALGTTYTFNPTTNLFALTPAPMVTSRYWHMAALLSNGTVLATAGWDQFGQGPKTALQSAEIFDTGQGTWSSVQGGAQAIVAGHTWGNMHVFGQNVIVVNGARFDNAVPPTQQQMPIGIAIFGVSPQAVMIGSPGSTGSFSSGGEIYNVTNGLFGSGPASTRNNGQNGVLLSGSARLASDGNIYFAGGENLGPNRDTRFQNLSSTELLEISTGQFKAGPEIGESVPPATAGNPPTPIPTTHTEVGEIGVSGDVLIVGGAILTQQGPLETDFCEIYDALNNLMKGNLTLAEGRIDHRVVPITGTNTILVIGGRDAAMNAPKDTCEIYAR
ncbi:MAG: hypothetical protein JKY65_15035 [Planctomycetes bacterium]|nr:hypothetical protein [Planctomycetota bacterium]